MHIAIVTIMHMDVCNTFYTLTLHAYCTLLVGIRCTATFSGRVRKLDLHYETY